MGPSGVCGIEVEGGRAISYDYGRGATASRAREVGLRLPVPTVSFDKPTPIRRSSSLHSSCFALRRSCGLSCSANARRRRSHDEIGMVRTVPGALVPLSKCSVVRSCSSIRTSTSWVSRAPQRCACIWTASTGWRRSPRGLCSRHESSANRSWSRAGGIAELFVTRDRAMLLGQLLGRPHARGGHGGERTRTRTKPRRCMRLASGVGLFPCTRCCRTQGAPAR